MTEIEPIDKSTWGDGPWQSEPDRWEGEHLGFPLLAVRHPRSGHWCGYVAVPSSHPAHRKPYDDVEVNVHGGLTYADACRDQICHVPKPDESDDVWWFGFDCAHSGDYSGMSYASKYVGKGYPWPDQPYDHAKAMSAVDDWSVEKYRTLEYVQAECRSLAEQLHTSSRATGRSVTPLSEKKMEEQDQDLARVEPLKAGSDGQDPPRRSNEAPLSPVRLTVNDLDNLRHMLGVGKRTPRGYRNYFVAGEDNIPSMERLRAHGFVEKNERYVLSSDPCYHATLDGARAVGLEQLP